MHGSKLQERGVRISLETSSMTTRKPRQRTILLDKVNMTASTMTILMSSGVNLAQQ